MYPFGNALGVHIPAQKPEEITALPIGSTVLNGTNVVNDNNIRKVPLLYHPEYLVQYAIEQKYMQIFTSLVTGAVPTPIKDVTGGSISNNGIAQGFTGPGMLTVKGNKLAINPPNNFVWGYITAYTVAVKTSDGVELVQNNKTLKTISTQDISNDTIPHLYVNLDDFKTLYNQSNVGNSLDLDYCLNNFSDGRNMVPPDKIKTYFGEDVLNYMETHEPTTNESILAYNGGNNEVVVGSSQTIMDAYANMDNNARVYNAMSFIQSWNNTIIPPHSTAYGSNNVSYTSVYDPDPTQLGWASHGTCPPGRALRDASSAAGFSIPTGMTWDYTNVIANDANLTSGIKIYNNNDYPVKVIMWSNGDNTGMPIYAKIVELLP